MRAALFIPFFCLLSCSRPLTTGETAFAEDLQGETISPSTVRVVHDVPLGVATFRREKRPRLACRERIYPEPTDDIVTASTAAVVLHNTVLLSTQWQKDDYLKGYPAQLNLSDAMLFAHEITHVWQWQNRAITGYSPRRAAKEHQVNDDPYRFDISTQSHFLEYGYEQQASIVEEYLCCALLDPDAPRTHRLKTMLQEVMPLSSLPTPMTVQLPWKGVELEGICH